MANELLMSLLSPEQRSQAQEDAFRQGLLGLSTGLIQAAFPQGGRRTSTLQALAQAAPGAVGAYKGSFDQTLKDLLTGMQVKDMMAKREREANLQKAIQGSFEMRPTMQGVLDTQTNIDPALLEGMSAEQVIAQAPKTERTLDRQKALTALAQYGGTEGLGAYLAATKPEKQLFTDTFANTALSMYGTADTTKLTPPQRLAVQAAVNAGKQPLVVMNEGQKGFTNEMDLKKAFNSEPVYKAGQEVLSAYSQIKAGLESKSPAGDLAAATKFMKLLDPNSVVRESELMMAMNATGLLDRFVNYANNIITGNTLNDTQREDFRQLSAKLYDAAANAYNKKHGEYSTLGTAYQLNPKRALGEQLPVIGGSIPSATTSQLDRVSAELKRRGL